MFLTSVKSAFLSMARTGDEWMAETPSLRRDSSLSDTPCENVTFWRNPLFYPVETTDFLF